MTSLDESDFPGALVISLDFELHWGLLNTYPLSSIESRLLGARKAVTAFLDLFSMYGIHATWAVVGFLFFQTKQQLLYAIPVVLPTIRNGDQSPYDILDGIGLNESEDPHHYANSLVESIRGTKFQEVATHTFAHFVWDDLPENLTAFREDLKAAAKCNQDENGFYSIVFPQNKYNEQQLRMAGEQGISAYRGKRRYWYSFLNRQDKLRRIFYRCARMMDHHIGISGNNLIAWDSIPASVPCNIMESWPLSCYPDKSWPAVFETLRLSRMKRSLSAAAKQRKIHHLWWHPHEFGVNTERSLVFLEKLLAHFAGLRDKYGMISLNMREVVEKISAKNIGQMSK